MTTRYLKFSLYLLLMIVLSISHTYEIKAIGILPPAPNLPTPGDVALDNIESFPTGEETAGQIPGLSNLAISLVPGLKDLPLSQITSFTGGLQNLQNLPGVPANLSNYTNTALKDIPGLNNMTIPAIPGLDKLKLTEIPGLKDVPAIQVPGLKELPGFTKLPNITSVPLKNLSSFMAVLKMTFLRVPFGFQIKEIVTCECSLFNHRYKPARAGLPAPLPFIPLNKGERFSGGSLATLPLNLPIPGLNRDEHDYKPIQEREWVMGISHTIPVLVPCVNLVFTWTGPKCKFEWGWLWRKIGTGGIPDYNTPIW